MKKKDWMKIALLSVIVMAVFFAITFFLKDYIIWIGLLGCILDGSLLKIGKK